jgi:hypothetical protein
MGSDGRLVHLSYTCPGLHEPGARQDIARCTFRQLMAEPGRLVVPLFQRRYCWQLPTVWRWFEDVVRGKRDHLGVHNSGNLIVRRLDGPGGGSLVIIDGQQRLTSMMLLLASLRDSLAGVEGGGPCVRAIQAVLWRGEASGHQGGLEEGQDLPASRLLPSFSDRRSFFLQLLGRPEPRPEGEEGLTFQAGAKAAFDRRVREETMGLGPRDRLRWTEATLAAALDRMGATRCEILTDVNMAQVFLWLQEKSLFGEGALLENKTPGVFFSGADMVRNLVLSPTMAMDMAEQEEFHLQHWLRPLERRLGDAESLELLLEQFVARHTTEHVSGCESSVEQMLRSNRVSSFSVQGKRHIRALRGAYYLSSLYGHQPRALRF